MKLYKRKNLASAFIVSGLLLGWQSSAAKDETAKELSQDATEQEAKVLDNRDIPVIDIKDAIHVGSTEFIRRGIDSARDSGAPALVIRLDTPGGFLEATRDIVQLFLATKDVKIVIWVSPEGARAASAGSMLTMAAHYAAMAPSTSIGAATPVTMGQEMGESMQNKVTNDTTAFVEGIARARNRNVEWAKKSVTEAASLESAEALEKNVIDGVHDSMSDLWAGVHAKFPELARDVTFYTLEPNLKDRLLAFISNPNVSYGLLALGTLGIYVEITSPGFGVPGVIGVLSLALGAISLKMVPIRPGAVILLILGFVLFALEILTPLPTYGVAGVLGVTSMILSGIFLMDPAQTDLGLSPEIWIPTAVLILAFMIWIGFAAARTLRSNPYAQGTQALLGQEGRVIKVLSDGRLKVRVHGAEIWNAVVEDTIRTEGQADFKVGSLVQVIGQEGFTLRVGPLGLKE